MSTYSFEQVRKLTYYTLKRMNIPKPYDDHFQEAFLVFNNCLCRYNPKRSKFSTFYVHNLHHHYKNLYRNEKRHHSSCYLLPSPVQPPDTIDTTLMLHDLIYHSHLSALEKDVLLLAYEGYTVKETAEKKNISISTVKRTRKKLKEKLSHLYVYSL
ncbi:sigma-70 family RNA polymerase sigma factor [Halobacillus yeomjeoni]|uniref:Sigma-70 family RNA polymerase sigma factor n=1 Tax=Halobacillus yeomjeoni TaxID=311194 RepID=A0A931HWJ7_9BACI|nr:sigma-70 family RNA polymerase sigma factor [Halobacillus yeomjeoni]MBH0230680.1 sigma-70 family RNA polymerase sigma factor [Halobacillus yeomjeoni]